MTTTSQNTGIKYLPQFSWTLPTLCAIYSRTDFPYHLTKAFRSVHCAKLKTCVGRPINSSNLFCVKYTSLCLRFQLQISQSFTLTEFISLISKIYANK